MTEALHPDHLQLGHLVGPWHIVQVLGLGGSSRVFKVERDGRPYSMKMALRPLSGSWEELSAEQYVEEKSIYRRLAREAATLFTYSSHPNLLRVYAVDFWPNPNNGYPFIVTDFIEGDTWHQWRWRKSPHSVGLVDTFCDVVRTVGVLHRRGVYHRDLKAENILIRRKDGRPFLIDFGTVRLPGALTQTMGVPEGVMHLLPPELIAYTRTGAWKRGEPFQGGAAADLYGLGVLLYQGLTDMHPFNPELPDDELVVAIATVPPEPPHLLNPLAPLSLSHIAMKLLEKRPEARYPDTEALLQALGEAARDRKSPSWKVPLTPPSEQGRPEVSSENQAAPRDHYPEATPEVQEVSTGIEEARLSENAQPRDEAQEDAPPTMHSTWRGRWLIAVLAGLLLLVGAIGLLSGPALLAPSPTAALGASAPAQREAPPMPTTPQDSAITTRSTSFSSLLAAWLCAATGLGCPAAQVKPEPEECPEETNRVMFRELKISVGSPLVAEISQPGAQSERGVYRDGPLVGRISYGDGLLVEGTLLYGTLWTGPGIYQFGREAVIGRFTSAVLPDGRKYSVCIVLGSQDGRVPKLPGSKPGAVHLQRTLPVSAVWDWP
jgi:serine/threonine-protein kinase